MTDRPKTDIWEPLRFLLGKWQGTCTGKPGNGVVERTFELILNDKYIQAAGRSTFEPQEQNPDGEIHEELAFFSFDQERKLYVYREFLTEGFVSRYLLEPPEPGAKKLVMATEAIENVPPNWVARLTLTIEGPNAFEETFELKGPNGDWDCYIATKLRRVA